MVYANAMRLTVPLFPKFTGIAITIYSVVFALLLSAIGFICSFLPYSQIYLAGVFLTLSGVGFVVILVIVLFKIRIIQPQH